jgi:hypothetical protein
MKRFVLLMALLILAVPVMALDTTTLDPGTSTDWNIWVLAGVLGLVLVLLSLRASPTPADVEIDAIISVMAWIPIVFCALTANAVSRVTSTGYVTVYNHWMVGLLMWVFALVALGNTIRLVAMHKVLRGELGSERGNYE